MNYIRDIPGLIAYYPLTESPGSTLYDAGPHHLNGTCSGVLADQGGLVGPSYRFDGTDGYCSVPHNRWLSPTDGFSVVALVNLRNLNRLNGIFDKSNYNLNGFRIYTNTSKKILFDVITASGDQLLSSRGDYPSINHWVLLTVSYSQDNQIIYINGQELQAQIGNSTFNVLSRDQDQFSDVHGIRAYPWGFESQLGHTTNMFNGDGTISMSSNGADNATLLAVPDLTYDKPIVFAGKSYTQSFDMKYNFTSGFGVRVIHQWFNSTVPGTKPFRTDYGRFHAGSSDWKTISLTATAPMGAIRGDIVLELWGAGTVQAKNPKFYLANAADAAVTTNTQPLLLGEVTDHDWPMDGYMQHVIYIDRPLSDTEVRSLARVFAPFTT